MKAKNPVSEAYEESIRIPANLHSGSQDSNHDDLERVEQDSLQVVPAQDEQQPVHPRRYLGHGRYDASFGFDVVGIGVLFEPVFKFQLLGLGQDCKGGLKVEFGVWVGRVEVCW